MRKRKKEKRRGKSKKNKRKLCVISLFLSSFSPSTANMRLDSSFQSSMSTLVSLNERLVTSFFFYHYSSFPFSLFLSSSFPFLSCSFLRCPSPDMIFDFSRAAHVKRKRMKERKRRKISRMKRKGENNKDE